MVDFGDKTIDLSVSSRVNRLNALLKGTLLLYYSHPLQVLIYCLQSLSRRAAVV